MLTVCKSCSRNANCNNSKRGHRDFKEYRAEKLVFQNLRGSHTGTLSCCVMFLAFMYEWDVHRALKNNVSLVYRVWFKNLNERASPES